MRRRGPIPIMCMGRTWGGRGDRGPATTIGRVSGRGQSHDQRQSNHVQRQSNHVTAPGECCHCYCVCARILTMLWWSYSRAPSGRRRGAKRRD